MSMNCHTCKIPMKCVDDAVDAQLRADWFECPSCKAWGEILYDDQGETVVKVTWMPPTLSAIPSMESKEELLKDGTEVIVEKDPTQTIRHIKMSIPSPLYGHSYVITGWPEVCELGDLIIVKRGK